MVHFAGLFRVELQAYCVMTNHFHVHLRTAEGDLGACMRSFLMSFTSTYNRRHGSGHPPGEHPTPRTEFLALVGGRD